ncbi:MAG: hypothetical protein ACOH2H_15130 [Cypionkella sp.]
MDMMLIEGDWLGTFSDGDRLAECGIPAPNGGKLGQRWTGAKWVDDPAAEGRALQRLTIMAEMIASERASMRADRWQLVVALGQDRWATVLAFRDAPESTWAMRQIIDTAVTIPRISETVDLLAYALGMDDAAVDQIFTVAMSLHA